MKKIIIVTILFIAFCKVDVTAQTYYLTDPTGSVSFLDEYKNDIIAIWNIDIGSNQKVEIDYDIDIEGEDYDYIFFYSIAEDGTQVLIHSIGYSSSGYEKGTIYSSHFTGKMKIVFETDESVSVEDGHDFSGVNFDYSGYLKVIYTYDAAGNRISRYLEVQELKSTNSDMLIRPSSEVNWDRLGVNLFPNPTHGELILEFENYPKKEKITVELYNLAGKQMINQKINSNSSMLNLEPYPIGSYVLRLIVGQEQKTYQIVKH
jgi:hypothetical protein